ncbi:MAG: type II toxin-antitoxin system RelE/ParE family toxin [Proteobacteria bacterium]|nr:type II toxin-antitoxin system RelE/ParE family toxin [Pseudomonadota bacterium]
MARYRLSRPAEADLAHILATSRALWGADAERRYRAHLAAALRLAAADTRSPGMRDRAELGDAVHSLHLRHARGATGEDPMGRPVHVVFYRVVAPGLIEVIRVLHERMEPGRHLGALSEES